jgi:hypothetical protein
MRNKNALLAAGLSLFVLLMLAATNPRPDQFSVWLEIQGIKEGTGSAQQSGADLQSGAFGTIASSGSLPAIDSGFRQADCFIFSLYSSRKADGSPDRSYLGIARSFIRLR